ncbi:MAG TPA: hypothetical protein VFV39_10320 [Limnobacter sp.]|nr:hypothetical protein [Limnobacter sp.]
MSISVRLKFWFFDHYWWLLVVAIAGTVATVVGALLSVAYFLQKQKLDELRLFREIFKECNARYNDMNDALAKIAQKPPGALTKSDRAKVIDYLNLCGEEYLYFKRGYIEPSVWQAWHNGMKVVVSAPAIAEVWESEKSTSSYYELPL